MGGKYEKGIYNQLIEVMEKLEIMEGECKKYRKEIKSLNSEVKSLKNENARLKEELARVKAPNTYNSRKPTKKKAGAWPGHKGNNISKADVEKKINDGLFEHKIKDIVNAENPYITRYMLDLEVKTVATEIRIHADENGKYNIPDEYRADVIYGDNIKAITAFLYSEGVVANDRICTFINSLSGDVLSLSTGSIYNFCNDFAEACAKVRPVIENAILNSEKVCTDATVVTTNGKNTYIRNFSTKDYVLYYSCEKKNLETKVG